MLQKINEQIENIDKSIEWIRSNKPEHFDQRFIPLVEERRKLRILRNAERNNPSIAAFGQSQVGKSYLMNCILQSNGSPFMVSDADGTEYDFVETINPIGEGGEATGVVTRFSSYSRNECDFCRQYPIRMKVLSVKDILCIISDTYFNEFDDYTTLGECEISQLCEEWKQKYADAPTQSTPALIADDILDMKFYFKKHINNAQAYSVKTPFFDTLATLIDKIPVTDYVKIFSKLWIVKDVDNVNNAPYTKLFARTIDVLKRLNFSEYVYLPIQAVLHNGSKEDTIMSVACLKLLDTSTEKSYVADVYGYAEEAAVKIGSFSKSELCAVCSEVVIRISDRFFSTTGRFDFSDMEPSSRDKINAMRTMSGIPMTNDGSVSLNVLKTTDLLDFPGARARGNMVLKQVINDHDNLMYSLLRGKVAYLFNKYNEEKIINILLFCHHHKNVEAPQMWQLLDEWVREYVGENPQKRALHIDQLGVSPLFHIGTMFNLNLQNPDNESAGKTDNAIASRWNERFKAQLLLGCFKNADWVSNWTGYGKPFQNCYMLRDYKFSQNIYSGWRETKSEAELLVGQDYFSRMRTQFIECNKDYNLFADPELAWDVASTRNNDGALYLLIQLSRVAEKIDSARENQIGEQLKECCQRVYALMRDYYQSGDPEKILADNVRKAIAISREMDFTCNSDNYFFGHLLQALQMTDTECYQVIHKEIHNPKLNQKVNSFKEYEIIINRCRREGYPIDVDVPIEEKWNNLIKAYRFSGKPEAESYLNRKDVDPDILFRTKLYRKQNSYILADTVVDKWIATIKSVDFLNRFSSDSGFDAAVMGNLIDGIINTATRMTLNDRMAVSIAEYVNVADIHTANESFIADILASAINSFVLDFGYSLLSESEIEAAKKRCEDNRLHAFDYISRELPTPYDEAALTTMFNDMYEKPKALLPSFEYNYCKWMEYMFISYVVYLNVPSDFKPEANSILKTLLDSLQAA